MSATVRTPSEFMTTTFQILSYLHLELNHKYATYTIPPTSPYLILAGDVGTLAGYDAYASFLRRHTPHFKQVFLVLGNHEFHHLSHTEAMTRARRLETEDGLRGKLTLLHRGRFDLDDDDDGQSVVILGCTLWTSIPDSARVVVEAKVKDYKFIEDWSVDRHNAEYTADVKWLRQEIQSVYEEGLVTGRRRKVLVITHHAPSNIGTSNPIHVDNPWTSAFSSGLLEREARDWIGLEGVGCWVFGHTHWTTEFEVGGTKVVSNQRGYVKDPCEHAPAQEGKDGGGKDKRHTYDENRIICV